MSGNGDLIVSASRDKTVRVWDAKSGPPLHTLQGHSAPVNGCAVSGNGELIVSASHDETVRVWDAKTGRPLHTLQGHSNAVNGCAVSGNGELIVSASWDRTVRVWDAKAGACLATLQTDGPLSGCAFHPDGKRLVACGAHGVYFLELVREEPEARRSPS